MKTIAGLLTAWLLAGCASNNFYTNGSLLSDPVKLKLEQQSRSSPERRSSFEHYDEYDLIVSEFDDQGWVQPGIPAGTNHVDNVVGKLSVLLKQNQLTEKAGLSVVIYVHGWHHSAKADDSDLNEFKALLEQIKNAEDLTGTKRRVVGLYLAWRGDSIETPGINIATFWDRKYTAEKVAQGNIRELFEKIDILKDFRGGDIRLLTIGHSFGGLIAFEALSGSMIRAAAKNTKSLTQCHGDGANERFGDLVLLVNPAFEGVRYEAVYNAAKSADCFTNETRPMLVTVTSEADQATGFWFPAARHISTIFETVNSQQREPNFHTVGFSERYLTHTLDSSCTDGQCNGSCKNVSDEYNFVTSKPNGFNGSQESTCNGLTLMRTTQKLAANPFWVVKVSGEVIKDHGDIFNPRFMSFVRQIYMDMRVHEETALRNNHKRDQVGRK